MNHIVVDPATLDVIGEVTFASRLDVDFAVRSAADMLQTSWRWDGIARATALRSWAGKLRAHADELVIDLVAQTGKPIAEARREVMSCAATLEYYAGMARYVGGRAGTLSDGSEAHLVREPVGVTAVIVPYNWPAALMFRDLAPALAAGVTAVVKPAPQTSLVALRLIELGRQAGVPHDAVSVLMGDHLIGEALVTHPQVRAVAFTGSTDVGRRIGRLAADGVKRALLELGGKGVSVIFADADLGAALSASLAASVITAGQMCMACTRILVHASRFREAKHYLTTEVSKIVVGNPRKADTQVGPLISQLQLDKVCRYFDIASNEGTILSGGMPIQPDGLPGYFVAPTIVGDLGPASAVVQDDIFGPVLTLEVFEDEVQATTLANATPYGLAASVWTSSIDTAIRVSREIQAGSIWINGYNRNSPEMPSGGVKNSGLGRTRGIEGIEEFTVLKNIHFSIDSL